ncbi:MAG: hypothetical protein AAFS10_24065, partial [Myxococcota bacterium]
MTDTTARLDTLRSLVHEPPSPEAWDAICALLDDASNSALNAGVELAYALEHQRGWPARVKVPPAKWVARWLGGQSEPRLSIMDWFVYEGRVIKPYECDLYLRTLCSKAIGGGTALCGLGELEHMAFSPDGAYTAASGGQGLVIWPLDEGHFSLLDRPARAMAFSPDSSALVIGNHKGQLVQLAMPYGVVEQTWPLAAPGEPDVLSRELSFSPDGRFIAVTGRSPEGHAVPARVLDRHQGTVQTLTSHTAIHTALFNPQGTRIVGCGGDHIVVWSFPEMEVLRDVECPNAWLLDIHPDGERLAVVTGDGNDWDNVLHLIDATTGETLNSTEVMATSIAFHPDGQTLVYGSSRHGHLYRLSADLEGEETFIGTHSDNTPDALFFDTSGEHLASSSYQEGMIRFFEPNERLFWRYTQSGFASPSGRFAASPNQEWLLLGSVEGGGYGGPEVWSLEDLKPLGMLQHDMLCPQPMFNP